MKNFYPKCHELAVYFLSNSPKVFTDETLSDLAAAIQQAVEDWMAKLEGDHA